MAFVDLELAKKHVRLDGSYEDDLVSMYLDAAEASAEEYLGRKVYSDEEALSAAVLNGEAGDDPILATNLIRAAVLLIFGHLYANREDVITGTIATQLPMGSRSLLQPYRHGLGV